MARFKLTIEYDGSRYAGWQIQRNEKTIQGAFFDACKKVFGEKTKFDFYGSGRTDAGVHALEQIAHLEVDTKLPLDRIRMALNDNLPYDINVLKVENAHPKFHARFDAKERSYVYLISKRRSAFGKSYIWWVKDRLNIQVMRSAARLLEGKHDFQSFTERDVESDSTLVHLTKVDIIETENLIAIHIMGSHFLWKMVRRIVGVLVEIGRKKLPVTDITYFLSGYTNEPARYTAPSSGLYLEHVYYEGEKINREMTEIPGVLRLK